MQLFFDIVLLLTGFLSMIPVIQLFRTPREMKYRCLKYLVFATFAWTIIIFIERFVQQNSIIYYAHMISYPLKFLMASFMLCTIYNYVEQKLPKFLFYIIGVIFAVEIGFALSNNSTLYFLNLYIADMIDYTSLYSASNGRLFIYHLLITYTTLLVAVMYLAVFLTKNRKVRMYRSVTRTMSLGILIVLLFNALQLLVITTTTDLTYVSLVIATFLLYYEIYRKDMIFNLRTSGRGEILSNMREMYILTDHNKNIIELSNLLLSKYNIDSENYVGKPFSLLVHDLKKQLVIYEDYDVDQEGNENKDHLHLREKKFTIKRVDDYGYMYLLYDETQVFGLLRELNRLSNYDNMTGLHNRNFIENKFEEYNHQKQLGIISLDLNGLKANNDYLGHERGDYLLKSLSQKMKEVMHQKSGVEMARIGGDEFLIILKDTTLDTLTLCRQQLLDLCYHEEIEKRISVSVGIAYSEKECDIYELLQEADQDMYKMKQETSKEYSKQIVKYATDKDNYIR